MKVERIRPVCEHVVTPQCCIPARKLSPFAEYHYKPKRAAKLELKGFDPKLCYFHATHMIEGKPYCSTHAGMKALEILEGT